MKSALVAAVAALTEEEAVALWSVVAQWADNARNYFDETEGDSVTRAQLDVAERIERAGESAMAELA